MAEELAAEMMKQKDSDLNPKRKMCVIARGREEREEREDVDDSRGLLMGSR